MILVKSVFKNYQNAFVNFLISNLLNSIPIKVNFIIKLYINFLY